MVFNQNHASILHFIFSSSIIIIVGIPTGLWLMRHMLYANDPITYASTENSEGFMIGLHYPSMVNHPRIILEHLRSCLASAFSQNGLNETLFLNSLRNQITHTAVINAMIYPHPPLFQQI
jgi:hypothetical protein